MPTESTSKSIENPNPIPSLNTVSFGEVDAVLHWRESAADNKMYPLNDEEQEEAMFNRLKQIQILGKPDAKVKFAPTLKYDIRLKNGKAVPIGFSGMYVDFGDGAYLYENCDKSVFPQAIQRIIVNNQNDQYAYHNETDIKALLDMLALSPGHINFSEEDAHISLDVIMPGNYSAESYAVQKQGASYYVFRSFFSLYTCLGTISSDAYSQLEIAKNGQFGTQLHLTATSNGETIYPAGIFVCSATYDATSGCMVAVDAFPRIEDYINTLQTLTLAEDFSIWIKASEYSQYEIGLDGKTVKAGTVLSYSEFDGLPSGSYQVEIRITEDGDYVEALKQYESSFYVYYFLIKLL